MGWELRPPREDGRRRIADGGFSGFIGGLPSDERGRRPPRQRFCSQLTLLKCDLTLPVTRLQIRTILP